MPAFNSRLKEMQFLGVNVYAFVSAVGMIISFVLSVIFILTGKTPLAVLFSGLGFGALLVAVVSFKFNNRLFELNFVYSNWLLSRRHESWIDNKEIDNDAL